MSKVAIVFWSATGNTEAMANAIAEGARGAGAEVDFFSASEFEVENIASYSAIAFGCPSMGVEELEETEFQPMWDRVKDSLGGVKVFLFGSYGWGNGEWMDSWKESTSADVVETYICNSTPGDAEEAVCRELGAKMA